MEIRAYRPAHDASELWSLKRAFEESLGGSCGDEKERQYREKLTDTYRDRYLTWAETCHAEAPQCIQVAVTGEQRFVGYVFLLPASLGMIWDSGVINELFVRESHRGSGLADEFMDIAIELAQGQDLPMDRVVLDVGTNNERARRYYDRYGFEPWGDLLVHRLPR